MCVRRFVSDSVGRYGVGAACDMDGWRIYIPEVFFGCGLESTVVQCFRTCWMPCEIPLRMSPGGEVQPIRWTVAKILTM